MTGDQSRLLKIGDRLRWGDSLTDHGTVAANGWGGVVSGCRKNHDKDYNES
jgi:hypothetical protein